MASFPIVPGYRPSQPHGWPAVLPGQTTGMTLGGHVATQDFEHAGAAHRIRLDQLAYSQIPDEDFRQTVDQAFGATFSFFYLGGLLGHYRFNVQSHSVYVRPPNGRPALYGADLYVVLDTDREAVDPATLRWIQVVDRTGPGGCERFVDNSGRSHPFYFTGGLTSVEGDSLVNFSYTGLPAATPAASPLRERFSAKAYLAHDTGHRDRIGRDIITILGGVTYGWEVGPAPSDR